MAWGVTKDTLLLDQIDKGVHRHMYEKNCRSREQLPASALQRVVDRAVAAQCECRPGAAVVDVVTAGPTRPSSDSK